MKDHERTRQQLDPSASLGAWPLTILLAGGALGYALTRTALSTAEITLPVLSVLSLLVLAAACVLVVVATSARRAPFRRRTHVLVHCLVWVAVVSSAAGSWSTDTFIRDDWWPVSFGLLVLALSPYRPAKELAAWGTVSALFLGFLALLQSANPAAPTPPAADVLVVMAPMLALCYASVAYADTIVGSLEQWRRQTRRAGATMVDQFREGIARSVQQDRVTILGRDVLPYFSDILAKDTVTDVDRRRAREIADSIRRVMVTEADRTWLEALIDGEASPGSGAGWVSDDSRLASRMTREQRTVIRALLGALSEDSGFDRDSIRFRIDADGERARVRFTADFAATRRSARLLVAPYLAIMRVSFEQVRVESLQPTTEIGFSYELH
ncbi:MAG: hypothetical protein ABI275_08390 [Terrimesophilobacter sp.]